ncbi:MAG: hypothetical protein JSW58_05705 [Candidatus Latescibacterota bacterium]|nr:MAG: hypothetical protein JSW58_05705 [Candidatus Latescibacterota bacterium]
MRKINICAGNLSVEAELNDTTSANKIWEALPITGSANTWGDEIYFEIPVSADLESDAIEEVEVGTLGYWPPGKAFCIFFGKTPVSTGEKPRAYSPVNIVGSVTGDPDEFKKVTSGEEVKIERGTA